jgi:outer membrane biosynthesis protein TonB
MKSNSLVNPRAALVAACGIGLALGLASSARADMSDRKTVLTVNEPIQVREKLLQPGKYVFKLLRSPSDLHIVQIFNGDQSQIIDTVLAIPATRMEPTGDTQLTFWETPPGTAKALRRWFYPGDTMGQEFPYPKQLASLEAPPPAPKASAEPLPPAPEPTPMVEPDKTEPQPEPMTPKAQNDNDTEKQASEMAANEQPPQPPVTPAQPTEPQTPATSGTADRSAELPKTSSPYPTIGAIGLLCLGIFAAMRLKRPAR